MNKIKRALISLTDKSGIEEFAAALNELGVEILSTGGTAERLRQAGVGVVDVSEYTGFPVLQSGFIDAQYCGLQDRLTGFGASCLSGCE